MDSLDEYDIRDTFDALDEEKEGKLTIDKFYTLYLGLGFPKMTLEELRNKVRAIQGEDIVDVGTVIQLLFKFPSRDRKSEIAHCFSLIDADQKGYISAQDIERLAAEVCDPITTQEAENMMRESATSSKLNRNDFRKLLAPPSP